MTNILTDVRHPQFAITVILCIFACLFSVSASSAQDTDFSPHILFQQIYAIEADALTSGWTAARLQDVGDLWEQAGQVEHAIAYWERSVALEPNVDLLQRLTLAYINGQMFDTALATLGQIQQLEANNNWAIYYTALILAPIQPEEALGYAHELLLHETYGHTMQDLYSILNSNRPHIYIVSDVAALYADRRLWPLAEYAFQYAAEQYAPFPDALAYTALMRAMQGKDSTERLHEALDLAPESSTIRMIAGMERRINQDYEASLSALLQAVVLEPINPVIYHELNLTYTNLGQTDGAENAEFVSQLLAGTVNAQGNDVSDGDTATLYIPGIGISQNALDSLSDLVEAKPEDQWLRAIYGWALLELGRVDGGLTLIEAAWNADTSDERVGMIAAQAYMATGQLAEASTILTTIASGDTPYAEVAGSILGIR